MEKFGKVLESKFAVQKNFHKVFKPLRKLGKGSSATVIEGEDLRDKRSYAIKGFKKSKGFSLKKVTFSLKPGHLPKRIRVHENQPASTNRKTELNLLNIKQFVHGL